MAAIENNFHNHFIAELVGVLQSSSSSHRLIGKLEPLLARWNGSPPEISMVLEYLGWNIKEQRIHSLIGMKQRRKAIAELREVDSILGGAPPSQGVSGEEMESLLQEARVTIDDQRTFTVLLLGKSFSGKSTLADVLLGRPAKKGAYETTTHVKVSETARGDYKLIVIDTPGMATSQWNEGKELREVLAKRTVDVVLLVSPEWYRYSMADRAVVSELVDLLPAELLQKIVVVFTHALEGEEEEQDGKYSREIFKKVALYYWRDLSSIAGVSTKNVQFALVENAARCPKNDQGEALLSDGTPWLPKLFQTMRIVGSLSASIALFGYLNSVPLKEALAKLHETTLSNVEAEAAAIRQRLRVQPTQQGTSLLNKLKKASSAIKRISIRSLDSQVDLLHDRIISLITKLEEMGGKQSDHIFGRLSDQGRAIAIAETCQHCSQGELATIVSKEIKGDVHLLAAVIKVLLAKISAPPAFVTAVEATNHMGFCSSILVNLLTSPQLPQRLCNVWMRLFSFCVNADLSKTKMSYLSFSIQLTPFIFSRVLDVRTQHHLEDFVLNVLMEFDEVQRGLAQEEKRRKKN